MRLVAAVLGAAGLLGLTGCQVPGIVSLWRSAGNDAADVADGSTAERKADGKEAQPRSREGEAAKSIDGAVVTEVGGVVSSECFSFELPHGYELRDASRDCAALIGFPDGDALTEILIAASVNPTTREGWRQLVEERSGGDVSVFEDREVAGWGGLETVYAADWGLRQKALVAFIPEDLFTSDGRPVTNVAIYGYWSEAFDPAFESIVASFKVKV
jgi:hypothetical protein